MRDTPDILPTRILLDVEAEHLSDCCHLAVEAFCEAEVVEDARRQLAHSALDAAVEAGPDHHGHHVAVVHGYVPIDQGCSVLLRLRKPIAVRGGKHGDSIWFVWVLLGPEHTHPKIGTVAEFEHLAADDTFLEQFLEASTAEELRAAYRQALHLDVLGRSYSQFSCHMLRKPHPVPISQAEASGHGKKSSTNHRLGATACNS